ncbi:MAG: ATP-dependent RecD-like DNA helicase, partial [Eubacteriales bacterium]|nr:ATP-dependent RecD-like DNA helicase [Eubacteriales bacterium]
MEIKRGNISEIIFHNSENGYTIGIMETKEEQFTVVGCLPSCQRGRSYELTGTFKVHPTYGEQFAFTEFVEIMPESEDGIEGFLASGFIKGIGPKTASLIVSRFGRETLNIIEKQPEKLAEIRGIGLKKAEQIGESFAAQREFADVSMFFQSVGVSADYAMKLYKAYGKDAVNLIEENP